MRLFSSLRGKSLGKWFAIRLMTRSSFKEQEPFRKCYFRNGTGKMPESTANSSVEKNTEQTSSVSNMWVTLMKDARHEFA